LSGSEDGNSSPGLFFRCLQIRLSLLELTGGRFILDARQHLILGNFSSNRAASVRHRLGESDEPVVLRSHADDEDRLDPHRPVNRRNGRAPNDLLYLSHGQIKKIDCAENDDREWHGRPKSPLRNLHLQSLELM
jgi:hypothetical protein